MPVIVFGMLRMIMSSDVASSEDMARVEEAIAEMLGGEHHKCAFVRSEAFVRLRLSALYRRGEPRDGPLTAFWDGLKVMLTPSGKVCVYACEACVEEVPEAFTQLGKRHLDEREGMAGACAEEDYGGEGDDYGGP